jgi:hypothetical protein
MIACRSAVTCAALHSCCFCFRSVLRFALLLRLRSLVAAQNRNPVRQIPRGIRVHITIRGECKNRNLAFATDVATRFLSIALPYRPHRYSLHKTVQQLQNSERPVAGCMHDHRSVHRLGQSASGSESADPARSSLRRGRPSMQRRIDCSLLGTDQLRDPIRDARPRRRADALPGTGSPYFIGLCKTTGYR